MQALKAPALIGPSSTKSTPSRSRCDRILAVGGRSLHITVPSVASSRAQCQQRQQQRMQPFAAAAAPPAASADTAAMRVVEVDLGDRSYPIYIGQQILDDGARLRQHIPGNRVLIVTNTTIEKLYLQKCVPTSCSSGAIGQQQQQQHSAASCGCSSSSSQSGLTAA